MTGDSPVTGLYTNKIDLIDSIQADVFSFRLSFTYIYVLLFMHYSFATVFLSQGYLLLHLQNPSTAGTFFLLNPAQILTIKCQPWP